jgi:hypothetical protein
MSVELIQEINSFIENSQEPQDSKALIDNFIAYNDATVQEINQFIELLSDWDSKESEREEKLSKGLAENWEDTPNEVVCVFQEASEFIGESFRNRYLGNGIYILTGVLKDSETGQIAIHSFKFNKQEPHKWSLERSQDWIEGKKVFDNSKVAKNLKYVEIGNVKIQHLLKEGAGLKITGIAISEGTWNGIYYPAEEIEKACPSLEGKPLRIDHSSSSRDIVGKVLKAVYNQAKKCIEFEAIVTDEEIAQKLLDNLIDSVSVGVLIDNEEENGQQVARNLEFKELSLVDEPACKDAKIQPVKNGGTD